MTKTQQKKQKISLDKQNSFVLDTIIKSIMKTCKSAWISTTCQPNNQQTAWTLDNFAVPTLHLDQEKDSLGCPFQLYSPAARYIALQLFCFTVLFGFAKAGEYNITLHFNAKYNCERSEQYNLTIRYELWDCYLTLTITVTFLTPLL